jgi:geranylgeranyl diphosphate synthase, type II
VKTFLELFVLNSALEVFEEALKEYLKHIPQKSPLLKPYTLVLSGKGKRVRPLIVLAVAEALKGVSDEAMPFMDAAIATELFHTASLIADDLPCMDDAIERRGKKTLHALFGEDKALLTSYALLAEGYRLISQTQKQESDKHHVRRLLAIENISFNMGLLGAAAGQSDDLSLTPLATKKEVLEMNQKKTATFFEASFVLGWLFGGGALSILPQVKRLSAHFGLAFQLADDIDDFEEDQRNHRFGNLAVFLGKKEAEKMFLAEQKAFYALLEKLEIKNKELLYAFAARMRFSLKSVEFS